MKHLILLALFCLGPIANASEWKHINLESEEGVKVSIDYTTYYKATNGCYKCQNYTYASPVWINVSGEQINKDSKVRVVFINKYKPTYTDFAYHAHANVELDLYPTIHGYFTGQIKSGYGYDDYSNPEIPIHSSGYGGTWYYNQEIAIVVDGVWQKDPVSGQNNFKFYMNY